MNGVQAKMQPNGNPPETNNNPIEAEPKVQGNGDHAPMSGKPEVLLSPVDGDCPTITGYDYIVIGSGPGGGPLSCNLSRRGFKVLLLEAGDDQGQNPNEKIPAFWLNSTEDPSMRWDYFVRHYASDTQAARDSKMVWTTPSGASYVGPDPPEGSTMRGIWYPRAGTLGGCASHNGLVAVLPHDSDWEHIANITGDESWAPGEMRKYFERLERCRYVPEGTKGHGFHGWLETELPDPVNLTSSRAVVEAAVRVAGSAENNPEDGNGPPPVDGVHLDVNAPHGQRKDGVFQIPMSMSNNARRSSTRNYLVATANARNQDGSRKYPLRILTHSFATKLLFDKSGTKPKVVGVEFMEGASLYKADPRYDPRRPGVRKRAFAAKEVIVAGGAFNSPQLLMLSGIGPKAQLETLSIPVVVDLPGVGRNLQDNYEMSVVASGSSDFSLFKHSGFGAAGDLFLRQWVQGFGPYKGDGLSCGVLHKTKHSGVEDLFLFGLPGTFTGFYPGYSRAAFASFQAWTWDVLKFRPRNTAGTVRLRSKDPFDTPDINFNYFAPEKQEEDDGNDPEHDLAAMAEGVRTAREILADVEPPVGPFTEQSPGANKQTVPQIEQATMDEAFGHHAAATCKIGADNDPLAVLDARFRVRGVDGLRVVDASSFPRVPGTFPQLPIMMISEKASDLIAEDAIVAEDDLVLQGVRDGEVLVDDRWTNGIVEEQFGQRLAKMRV